MGYWDWWDPSGWVDDFTLYAAIHCAIPGHCELGDVALVTLDTPLYMDVTRVSTFVNATRGRSKTGIQIWEQIWNKRGDKVQSANLK